MLNSIFGLMFSISGLLLATKINTTGIGSKILVIIILLLFIVGFANCATALLHCLYNRIFVYVFSFSGIFIAVYGMWKYKPLFRQILGLF